MATYCISAAKHANPSNHVASSFLLWQKDEKTDTWTKLGARSAKVVVELLELKNTVLTAKFNATANTLDLGAPIEVELRISKNETKFPITTMPTF